MPLRIIAAILLLVCSFSSISGASALSLNESRELLDRGKSYFFTDPMRPDSAAICFRQVADSYSPEMSREQKEICGTAANNLGYTCYQYLRDYKAAYQALTLARDICDDTGRPLTSANVCMNFGNLYAIFAEQSDAPEFEQEAFEMYRRAFNIA